MCVCEREGESVPFRTKEGKGGGGLNECSVGLERERIFFFSSSFFLLSEGLTFHPFARRALFRLSFCYFFSLAREALGRALSSCHLHQSQIEPAAGRAVTRGL